MYRAENLYGVLLEWICYTHTYRCCMSLLTTQKQQIDLCYLYVLSRCKSEWINSVDNRRTVLQTDTSGLQLHETSEGTRLDDQF